MKKIIGICLAFVLCGVTIWGVSRFLTPKEELPDVPPAAPTERMETEETGAHDEETTESMTVQEPFLYILRETDGMLVVYEQDGTTVWMETGIRTEHMEPEVARLFQEGVTIRDERELYDLLESYSS